ncbi:tRNA 2-thiouridine(34) synthase MnmA [Raoultibacter phocaeensis]|uniref:tRNA 2-thiouridine(34) synthase MnmA n=1 Tax=Raoultibacter phocaeensis TaxID=2479841 RepID=UPI00111B2F84|nr:tRNA 2-thiouridine(34) synthase MnmA [Raoultibacter phocaeensis]
MKDVGFDTATRRIALGMSGGVDSAVSAAVLMRAGYEVVGVTCLFTDDEKSRAAARDAAAVCELLGIEHAVWKCSEAFEREVVGPFVDGYARGLTPSPCVSCNARCKVPQLLAAADELGCEKAATGHYARIARLEESGRFVVKAALDASKDQSYMLSQLTQEQLERLVFPLGAATKADVRVLAADLGLPVADKPESQDICFIEGDHRVFLEQRGVCDEPGTIVDAHGTVLGRHDGLVRYTIGQRKGIGIAAPEPYYVIGKRFDRNELVVGFKDETLIDFVTVANPNWQAFDALAEPLDCMVKLRYRSTKVACTVHSCDGGSVEVRLISPQPTTAPGQHAVFYLGETVLGGGMIVEVGTAALSASAR